MLHSKKRVFITGATGFVGAWTTRALLHAGHDVHALMLEGAAEDALAKERLGADSAITPIRGDFLRPSSYLPAVEALKPDVCIHLAWYANPKDYLSSRINLEFLDATIKLGTKLIDIGCPRFVAAGTCFEYDTSWPGYLAEDAPLIPRHLYSTCKRALFDILTSLTHGTATSFAWPRLFFLFGEHEAKGRLVPAVIDALLGSEPARVTTGEQVRDYMHVGDAGRAIAHIATNALVTGPINVATGEPLPVRKLIETIATIMQKPDQVAWGAIEARPNDPAFICANVEKLEATGFRPESSLEQGLAATISAATKKHLLAQGASQATEGTSTSRSESGSESGAA